MLDLIIIGAGAAGLTAAIYAARGGLDFLVLEQDGWGGGQITSANEVENYPGTGRIAGGDLGEQFKTQAEELGAKIQMGIVESVRRQEDHFEVLLHKGDSLQAKTVIAATGAVPRKLGIPGEGELLGRGVSYCAVCDGAFFADQDVAVIGGGDTAVEDALFLAGFCRSVTLIHRREGFRAPGKRTDALRAEEKITLRLNQTPEAILGDSLVEGIRVKRRDGTTEDLPVQAVFVAVGTLPVTDYLAGLPLSVEEGYVTAGESGATEVPGLFVAGDIRRKRLRQVVTAAADGANAATAAMDYLQGDPAAVR
jgi:thioredoxin reductase (NADPH)